MSRTIWALIGAVGLCTIGSTLAIFLACRPFAAFWLQVNYLWASQHAYHCDNSGAYVVVITVINVVLDVIITMLPTALLWKLKLPIRQKAAVWGVFTVGLLAAVAAVMRIDAAVVSFYQTYDTICKYSHRSTHCPLTLQTVN